MLKEGDKAPDLLGLDENGNQVKRSDYPGRRIALYFYPKDSTSGCTAQACNLRDNYTELLDAGYQGDRSQRGSRRFPHQVPRQNSLPFSLITDTDHALVEQFGVWGEKSMYGRKYMGTFRTTFIIEPDGTISRVIGPKQIKTSAHASQILAS